MARNFNRGVPGLLGYLDQKSDGRNPSYLAEVTQPVIDLDLWLRSEAEFRATASIPIAASAQVVSSAFTVPQGEAWLAFDIEFGLLLTAPSTVAVGDMFSVQLGMRANLGFGADVALGPIDRALINGGVALVSNGGPFLVSRREAPVVMRPGDLLSGRVNLSSAGPLTAFIRWGARILRFSP